MSPLLAVDAALDATTGAAAHGVGEQLVPGVTAGQFLALVMALIAFITTLRLWLNKARADAKDAIGKEGYWVRSPAGEVLLGPREDYIRRLRKRVETIGWQLLLLTLADVGAITAGVVLVIRVFREWLPYPKLLGGNWVWRDGEWNSGVAGFQIFFFAVIVLTLLHLFFVGWMAIKLFRELVLRKGNTPQAEAGEGLTVAVSGLEKVSSGLAKMKAEWTAVDAIRQGVEDELRAVGSEVERVKGRIEAIAASKKTE